jgi:hypothetical protein
MERRNIRLGLALVALLCATNAFAQTAANPLLAIDQHRTTIVDRVVNEWGDKLTGTSAGLNREQMRDMLFAMRADQLLAASLAGSLTGLRDVLAHSLTTAATPKPSMQRVKALGDSADDVVYTPVTPCRLVETRGTFAAVYQGGGAFSGGETRNYTAEGGNGVCLTQLPAGLNPSALQLQVFGIPINSGSSGDIEILPQGSSFGSTATEVYVGNVAFNSVSTTAKINQANNQIGVQVRGGGADVAIDVVGYFKRPGNYGGIHVITGLFATDSGGFQNRAEGAYSTVAGGDGNSASGGASYNTVGGGVSNNAGASYSTVAGGNFSSATGPSSTIGGGNTNRAGGAFSTIAGGNNNTASGSYSAIGGGRDNIAQGDYSVAAGRRAHASTTGSFIFADSQNFDFGPSVSNFFGVRATGGVGLTIAIDPTTGGVTQFCNLLPPIASWSCTSDRDAKENFVAADGKDILQRLVAMPLFSWNFKGADPTIRSLGPTAQDFYAAFSLGKNDKTIANVNLEGVALAAIQGLNAKVDEQQREIADLRRVLLELRSAIEVTTAMH